MGTLAVIAAIAVARSWLAGVQWLPTLVANLAASPSTNPTGPTTQRLNLQALLGLALPGQDWLVIEGLTLGVGLVAGALVALALRHRRDREANLLVWSAASVLTLLMVYNRSYDAVLLVLPLAWVFAPLRPHALRWVAATIAVACAVFLVPGAAVMAGIRLPADLRWVGTTPWWSLLRVHQIIALLVVLAALTVAAVRHPVAKPIGKPTGIAPPSRPVLR